MVICAAAIAAGIMMGYSAVVLFNRMPGKWLCDYGKEPDEELAPPDEAEDKQLFRGNTVFSVFLSWPPERRPWMIRDMLSYP